MWCIVWFHLHLTIWDQYWLIVRFVVEKTQNPVLARAQPLAVQRQSWWDHRGWCVRSEGWRWNCEEMKLPLNGRSHVSVDRSEGPPTGGENGRYFIASKNSTTEGSWLCGAEVKLREIKKRVLPWLRWVFSLKVFHQETSLQSTCWWCTQESRHCSL